MSILNNIQDRFHDVFELFYPHVCPICGARIEGREQTVCTACSADAPLTGFELLADNPVSRRVWNLIPADNASAMLYYIHEGKWTRMVSEFKFGGQWRFALSMGKMWGATLARSPLYAAIDTVIPIPLHPLRALSRGYNQSEYLAQGVASALNADLITDAVVRKRHNRSQRTVSKSARWNNAESIFETVRPQILKGRRILLVDDVFTTGATSISCAETILRAVPDCHISIAALFVSKQELGIKD